MELKTIKKKLNENAELVFKKLKIEYEILGDNIYCQCPIHEGSDNPRAVSFSIDKGMWKCWTRECQQHYRNDIFGLISGVLSSRSHEEKTFSDVLSWSCNLLNIKNNVQCSNVTVKDEEDGFLNVVKILNEKQEAVEHKTLDLDFDIAYPSEYFLSRNFKTQTLQHFSVGDCRSRGLLHNRSIIPIHDDCGKNLIGLIGRSTKDYINPKFLFYPKGFDKRYCLYNYHRAIEHVEKTNCLYIVEGQGDVWRLYEAGVKNVMSIFGKTVTKQQEDKINKLPITHIIVLTDNDQAGRESKTQIKRQFNRMYKLTFPRITTKDIGEMKVKDIKKILENLKGTY